MHWSHANASIRAFLRNDGGLQFEQYNPSTYLLSQTDKTANVQIMVNDRRTLTYKHGQRKPSCLWHTDHWPHPWKGQNTSVTFHVTEDADLTIDGQQEMQHLVCHNDMPLALTMSIQGSLRLSNTHETWHFAETKMNLFAGAKLESVPPTKWNSTQTITWKMVSDGPDDTAYVNGIRVQTPEDLEVHWLDTGHGNIVWSPPPSRQFVERPFYRIRTMRYTTTLPNYPSIRIRNSHLDVSGPCTPYSRWLHDERHLQFKQLKSTNIAPAKYSAFLSCASSWTLQALAEPPVVYTSQGPHAFVTEEARQQRQRANPNQGTRDEEKLFPGLRIVHSRSFFHESPADDDMYRAQTMELWDPLRDVSVFSEQTFVRRNATLDSYGWFALTHVSNIVMDRNVRLVIDPDVVNPQAFMNRKKSQQYKTILNSARDTVQIHMQQNAVIDIRSIVLKDTRIQVYGPSSAVLHLAHSTTDNVWIESYGGVHVFVEHTFWKSGGIKGDALWLTENVFTESEMIIHPRVGECNNNHIIDTIFHIEPTGLRHVPVSVKDMNMAFMFNFGNNQMIRRDNKYAGIRLHPHLIMQGRTVQSERHGKRVTDTMSKTYINWDAGATSNYDSSAQRLSVKSIAEVSYAQRLHAVAGGLTEQQTTNTSSSSSFNSSTWPMDENSTRVQSTASQQCRDEMTWETNSTLECPSYGFEFTENLCPDICTFAYEIGCPINTADFSTTFFYVAVIGFMLTVGILFCRCCYMKALGSS